ncbi:MAG: FKBP-type peptidyl-prolyl cis-trans isomerase [Dysgonamonadaceae bacterium]|jgi:FKBP-type peptidyl-prolyl cis-trans isomerase FklB|nr:FKBP-type peptidyl-prolyl cis-trans isomerase [Dysgonamonadaceae bacterium]
MKKLLSITGLFIMVFFTAAMISCNAQAPKANLKTEIDSLSYAAGVDLVNNQYQGLGQYLTRMEIDSTIMKDFVNGFLEGSKMDKDDKMKKADKKLSARLLGLQIGQQVCNNMFENMNRDYFGQDSTQMLDKDILVSGIVSALLDKKLLIEKEEAQNYANTVGEKLRNASFEKQHAAEKKENVKFLEENKLKEGVVTLPSGLQYKVIKEGKGAKPVATDLVKVDYTGTTIDGKEFDSSVKQGKPAEFSLNGVIAGWTEGLQLMSVGSKYIFYIPYELAYGAQGRPGSIPPFATLIFEIDLREIVAKK